jgi:aminocarboxymuconate-semialdehyde decarboxylase
LIIYLGKGIALVQNNTRSFNMPPIVDIHTHIYPPSFITLLKSRRKVPYILDLEDPSQPSRLIILPSDDSPNLPPHKRGRPVDSTYTSIEEKLLFMRNHNISASVISLANPWLDFLDPGEAAPEARKLNDEMDRICDEHRGKLYAFGTLPLSGSSTDVVSEIARLSKMKHTRGVIMGTTGLGKGLDDPTLDPIYAELQRTKTIIFLHPHYGLPASVYGPRAEEYGHVLPLALGFPLETTIAVTRMLLSGVFDRFPKLEVLLAHSGGTLPFLAGRIESCVKHERVFLGSDNKGPQKSIWDVLKQNVYLDAVVYGDVGLKAAVHAEGGDTSRVLFGTDHPFFPPLEEGGTEWLSVKTNYEAIRAGFGEGTEAANAILGGNAIQILHLDEANEALVEAAHDQKARDMIWSDNLNRGVGSTLR